MYEYNIIIDKKLTNQFYQELCSFSEQTIWKEYYFDLEVGKNHMVWYGSPIIIIQEEIEGLSKANKDVTIVFEVTTDEEGYYFYVYKNGILINSEG